MTLAAATPSIRKTVLDQSLRLRICRWRKRLRRRIARHEGLRERSASPDPFPAVEIFHCPRWLGKRHPGDVSLQVACVRPAF